MAPLVILRPEGEVFLARRARLRERLTASWCTARLDGDLARGVAPESTATLALRAHALGEPRTRKLLARSLRHVVDDSARMRPPLGARVPVARDEVLAASDALNELADRLLAPGVLGAAGIAQVSRLLSDGSGPLYRRGAAETLRAAAARALDGLEPAFRW